jgi:sugar phosphate isomerase/epimerase
MQLTGGSGKSIVGPGGQGQVMRIGVFSVLFGDVPFEQVLDRAVASGVSAVEIGTGGYPGNSHCPLESLLASSERRHEYMDALARRGLILSALSCQSEPLHPNPAVAKAADNLYKKNRTTCQPVRCARGQCVVRRSCRRARGFEPQLDNLPVASILS